MLQQLLAAVRSELSGPAAKALVARISQWHRIQASPMYREAAEWVYHSLRSWGIAAELESYPSREGVWAWGEPLFQEWSCRAGWLDLLLADGRRERLADYRALPLSLMPRSTPIDGEFELTVLDGGTQLEHYDGLDVRGRLVLSRSSPAAVHAIAVERLGAAGVIYDGMRSIEVICPPGDLPDARQYASWWWWGGETRCFGFVLSPRQGAELRRRARRGSIKLHAYVDSQLYDGAIEAVSACIPGSGPEEVLLMAHLCHPAPCANDNASGAAAVLEIARGLHHLIESGKIARPKRSIRFLWVPEMTGTYLYLERHAAQIERIVAGLNLDMVGADQALTGSVNLVVRTPDATASFVADLLEVVRESLAAPAHRFNGRSDPPLYRQAVTPISNGSDHYILADPTVGIPTPMLIEWPDRYYHTSEDTLEKVSPQTLERNMTIAATYTLLLASAGLREAAWLADEMQARFVARLAHELAAAARETRGGHANRGPVWIDRIAYRVDRQQAALADLRRLDPTFDPASYQAAAQAQAELLWGQFRSQLEAQHKPERSKLNPEDAALIPHRRYRGPVGPRAHLSRLALAERSNVEAALRRHPISSLSADLALYWADGKRTLGEILDLVELECDERNPAGLRTYFGVLERLGLIDFLSS
ncbi:MAG: DUF4910 domain-containing protein [Oscillochloris sp.]|nr:DUF4910 domain-containing protein [Oscillochloris sp.]